MKKNVFFLLALLLVLFVCASCTNISGQPSNRQTTEASLKDQNYPEHHLPENYYPYNRMTVTDGSSIYYFELDGIYKWQSGEKYAEKLQSGVLIKAIAIVENYIYYIDNGIMYRINTDTASRVEVKTNLDITGVVQLLGLREEIAISLFQPDSKKISYYIANPFNKSDDAIYFEKLPNGFPAPNGAAYSFDMNSITSSEYPLYPILMFPNFLDTTQEKLYGMLANAIMVTDKYIFYCNDGGIWRSFLDGSKINLFFDKKDMTRFTFLNYDSKWLYCDGELNGLIRINQETGESESLPLITVHQFDVIDGKIYSYENGKKIVWIEDESGYIKELLIES